MKFLIPFSLFVEIGHRLSWSTAPAIAQPRLALVVNRISQPFVTPDFYSFTPTAAAPVSAINPSRAFRDLDLWLRGGSDLLVRTVASRCHGPALTAMPMNEGREVSALRRTV